ncbi:polysaccharide deacetylase family protein [Paenibacillus thailandensis]|jgi:peptidoglycan/xylan/chitin deacetylase (PgdA/CDA1 family)|uniref:Polysaccharide deacetylase family protein n=1 Tax=Paenibacillus thailandensis TaxID=393250 RepID=A0ABW5QRA0_9BACL
MNPAMMISRVKTEKKAVAFTFDDGPNPIYTPQLLQIFGQTGGKATFFMLGSQIEIHPEVARAVHAQGHEIGNHTYSHPHLSRLSGPECLEELVRTEQLIVGITGTRPAVFRPPYMDYNEQTAAIALSLQYRVAGAANVGTMDWEQPGVDFIVDKTKETLRPGNILLFHDGFGDRSQTVEAVRRLVLELTSDGYKLVTVSGLLRLGEPEA